jgi:hypothetical protein
MKKFLIIALAFILLALPLTGSIELGNEDTATYNIPDLPYIKSIQLSDSEQSWWERTIFDQDRNHIHDSLDYLIEDGGDYFVDVYLNYMHEPTSQDVTDLVSRGLKIGVILPVLQAIGLEDVPIAALPSLTDLEEVIMIVLL